MHFLLYVCLPIDQAKTSLQARRRVCQYLIEEQFIHNGRFCRVCDYFSMGGRYSGMLNMLRLKHHHPQKYKQYLAQAHIGLDAKEVHKVFKHCFPDDHGMKPVCRNNVRFHGYPDDAQIMDEVLFTELKQGFNEDVTFALPFERPNVIFTDLCADEWPVEPTSGIGRHWVVVIDYHE
mgnify:CR=1 FL=1